MTETSDGPRMGDKNAGGIKKDPLNKAPASKKVHRGQEKNKQVEEAEKPRYRTRIIKGAFLPVLYVFISFMMLRNYVSEFTGHYDYEILMMVAGFFLGLISMSGLTIYNLFRANKNKTRKVKVNTMATVFVFAPMLVAVLVLSLIWGISTAWQFSIGYFASALIPPFIVGFMELGAKGKFFVNDIEKPKRATEIILVPNPME